eukprot:jgi/Phyca11/130609/e_gw1.96.98.1
MPPKDQLPKPKATKKRRVRSAETSSTGLQRRKRAELASLRDQVEELQSVLVQLKNAERSPCPIMLWKRPRQRKRRRWR